MLSDDQGQESFWLGKEIPPTESRDNFTWGLSACSKKQLPFRRHVAKGVEVRLGGSGKHPPWQSVFIQWTGPSCPCT